MKRLAARVLAWIGGLVVLLFLLVLALTSGMRSGKTTVSDNTVLELNLETSVQEDRPDNPVAQILSQGQPSLREMVEALEQAGSDRRVKGLVAHLGSASLSMAEIQEIRDAVKSFREKGKFAVAFSETFGEFGPGTGAYYLASAFEEIWLQPSGDIGLTGIRMESQFFRGTLEKVGILPRLDHRFEYKNAMNQYTEKSFTPAHREAMTKVKDSWFGQVVRGIAEGRKMTPEQVRALVDRAPFLGKEAMDAKLVDGLAYRDEVFDRVKKKAGIGSSLLFLNKYSDRAVEIHEKGKRVALIFGVGGVQRGKSDIDPLQGTQSMGSDTVAGAFRQAINDNDVKAILFRVDSPGGSYVASDTIWREVVRARKAGKPVVVSMSSLAGSGGYFVAMAADKIVAHPGTITGSIGVLGGKMITKGLWDKVGVTYDSVQSGQNASMFDGYQDYTKEEWARFEAWLDRVYDDFTSKVADGRKLPKEKVLQIARGRIWTGEDAKAIGLVDELGGYPAALKLVKQAAKIPESEDVELRTYPRKRTRTEALMALLQGEERENSETHVMVRILESVRPVAQQLHSLGILGEQRGVLAMPEVAARP